MNEFFNNDSPPFVLNPEEEAVGIGNIFVQDSIGLTPTLTLTLGVKFEHSTYTGGEVLPNARLGWELSKSHMVWGAVSRAVRTPSRIDRDIEAPGIFEAAHSDFGSESLIAYELGYRGKPDDRSTLSATVYYHDYEELRVITTSPSSGLLTFGNDQDGYITGIESWGDYRLTNRWRISAGVNLLRKSLELGPNASTTAIVQHQGDDPEYQLFLRSFYNLTDDIELDVLVRRIGRLAIQDIPDYTALDLRVGWHVTDTLELALIGSDLLDRQHPETGGTNEIPRSVFVSARWRF